MVGALARLTKIRRRSDMAQPVTDDQVREYLSAVQALARQMSQVPGAEYDDYVQEGLISVWVALRNGKQPAAHIMKGRMINWRRHVEHSVPYDLEVGADEIL